MLHNEARNLLVRAYEQTRDVQTVAKCFQVSTSTVYRLSGQMKKTGSVYLQTSQRGRKPALTGEDLQDIDCQRRNEIVRKRRRNYVVFRRGGVTEIKRFLVQKECSQFAASGA